MSKGRAEKSPVTYRNHRLRSDFSARPCVFSPLKNPSFFILRGAHRHGRLAPTGIFLVNGVKNMSPWLYLLLLGVPVTIVADTLHWSPLVIFICASIALVPLAGLIGQSTEALAEHLGHRIGGLLNATFGNAAEIIIGLAALSHGLPEVVRASLAGSIVGNALLVLGTAMLVGGWKYRRQEFNARVAGQYASMLVLVVIGIAVPSLIATVGEGIKPGSKVVGGSQLHIISIWVSVILLICYIAYLAYTVFGLRANPNDLPPENEHKHIERAKSEIEEQKILRTSQGKTSLVPEANVGTSSMQVQSQQAGLMVALARIWKTSPWFPLVVLAAVTAVTALVSEQLVGTIEPLTHQIGLNPFFVGLIILPIVGNAAEHFSAITSAHRNHMEIAMAITAGSSIQIALLAAPILVIAGALLGTPLDLNFTLFEVALFGLIAVLYAFISLDGESTWLEGLLLCAFYLILTVCTFFTPMVG
jgi:Ca2+:H+ antiporter